MSQQPIKLQGLHLACAAMIAVAWAVAIVGIFVNAKNGQRLSLDASSGNLNWYILLFLSLAPVTATSVAGMFGRSGAWGACSAIFLMAILLVGFNIWLAGEYLGDQMLGRVKQSHNQQISNKEMVDRTNDEMIRSRREAEQSLWRSHAATKDPTEKKRLEEQAERLRNAPLALIAPMDAPAVGARASWLSDRWGWSQDTIAGITPSAIPIAMAAVEVVFSLIGFAKWPRQNSRGFPETFGKLTREEAKSHLLKMQKQGRELSNSEYAEKWGVPPGTASRWTSEFAQEGLTRRVQRGRRKVAVAPRPNGLHVVA